jgi:hypothetical protein
MKQERAGRQRQQRQQQRKLSFLRSGALQGYPGNMGRHVLAQGIMAHAWLAGKQRGSSQRSLLAIPPWPIHKGVTICCTGHCTVPVAGDVRRPNVWATPPIRARETVV